MHRSVAVWLSCAAMLFAATTASAQTSEKQRDPVILVAARQMMDPNFARTVVLVMFPRDSGPTGVILNRPTDIQLREIWPGREERQGRTEPIFVGGPVQPDGLLFLFRNESALEHAWPIIDNIYFSGNGDLLDELLEGQNAPVADQRFFAGYAGWTPAQLDSEVDNGDWYVLQVEPEIIYDTDVGTLWWRLYQRATLPRANLHWYRAPDSAVPTPG